MNSAQQDTIRSRLDKLRLEFIANIPSKAAALSQAWRSFTESNWHTNEASKVSSLAHQVRPLLEMFQFEDVARLAAALEEKIEASCAKALEKKLSKDAAAKIKECYTAFTSAFETIR